MSALLGSIVTIATLLAIGTRRPGLEAAGEREACDVSILLVVTGRNPASQLIDRLSGGLGYSHAALDACEHDDRGRPIGIDCRPGWGVVRRPLVEITEGRGVTRIRLPLVEGRELYGCVRALVGQRFDGLGLLRPSSTEGGLVCSGLIYRCLPARLKAQVQLPRGRPVAPNDLAAAWNARPGGPDVEVR